MTGTIQELSRIWHESPAEAGQIGSRELERVQEPSELLAVLLSFGFSDQDLARCSAATPRSVRRWRTAQPGTKATERLADLRNLVLRLRDSGGITDRGIVFWMRNRNLLLDDYSPHDVLGAGGFDSVRDAALNFVDPDRPFTKELTSAVHARLVKQASQSPHPDDEDAKARKVPISK